MKRKIKYESKMPRLLYTFFTSYSDSSGVPSFSKFARSIGATLRDIEGFRRHGKFDAAWRECSEIRRDYLIDSALSRRHDPSFVKFLLSAEFGMGEKEKEREDSSLTVTLEVLPEENNEA